MNWDHDAPHHIGRLTLPSHDSPFYTLPSRLVAESLKKEASKYTPPKDPSPLTITSTKISQGVTNLPHGYPKIGKSSLPQRVGMKKKKVKRKIVALKDLSSGDGEVVEDGDMDYQSLSADEHMIDESTPIVKDDESRHLQSAPSLSAASYNEGDVKGDDDDDDEGAVDEGGDEDSALRGENFSPAEFGDHVSSLLRKSRDLLIEAEPLRKKVTSKPVSGRSNNFDNVSTEGGSAVVGGRRKGAGGGRRQIVASSPEASATILLGTLNREGDTPSHMTNSTGISDKIEEEKHTPKRQDLGGGPPHQVHFAEVSLSHINTTSITSTSLEPGKSFPSPTESEKDALPLVGSPSPRDVPPLQSVKKFRNPIVSLGDREWENEIARNIITLYRANLVEDSDNKESLNPMEPKELKEQKKTQLSNTKLPALNTKNEKQTTKVTQSNKTITRFIPRLIWFSGSGLARAVWCGLAVKHEGGALEKEFTSATVEGLDCK